MKQTSVRKLINCVVFGIVAVQLLALVDVQHRMQFLDAASPILPLLTLIGLVALWGSSRMFSKRAQKLRVKSLQLSQESLALNTHSLVLETDAAGIVTYANNNFLKTTGYTEVEIIGHAVDKIHFTEDSALRAEFRKTVRSGGIWQGETRTKAKNGREIWTSLTILPRYDRLGNASGSIAVRTDITDAKKMRADHEMLGTLNCLPDEVLLFDIDALKLKYANAAAVSAHGLSRGLHLDVPLAELDAAYGGTDFKAAIGELRRGESPVVIERFEKRGRQFEAHLQLLDGPEGARHVLASFNDISERLAAERLRSEFISTVSHELRSPMTSVKGAMGLLLAGSAGQLPDRARDILEIAHRNSDRLINIINDLLDIEKIAAGKMSFDCAPHDLSALLDEAILGMETFSRRFDVSIERDESLGGEVMIDFDRSLQVMNNLLSNAAKFSPAGGKIEITGRDLGEVIEVRVRDHGKGIPEAMLSRVFEKFSQVDARADAPVRGTGLGLAIVKAIAEEQGGAVAVESTVGEGSSFSVTFPKAVAQAGAPERERLERAS